MCGMAGFVCDNAIDADIKALRNLLMLNMFRGEDSTGMFDCVPEQKPQLMTWKTDLHPLEFLSDKFKQAHLTRWKKHKPLFAAVHCRAATQGKISKQNAHPFRHGNIIGMHNGTVSGKFTNRDKYETDSEAIFYNISTMGLPAALEVMYHAEPAYALVWYDSKDKSLNFIRNSKRTLAYTEHFREAIYWSSDPVHLSMGVSSITYSKNKIETIPFKTGVHYKVDITAKTIKFTETEIKEAEEKPAANYTFFKNPYSTQEGSESESWQKFYGGTLEEKNKPVLNVANTPPPPEKVCELSDSSSFQMKKEVDGAEPLFPFGIGLTNFCNEYTFKQKTQQGCCCCGQKVVPGDATIWVDTKDFVCYDCAEELIYNDNYWAREANYFTEAQISSIYTDYEKLTYIAKEA